jgi:hypothetical protein
MEFSYKGNLLVLFEDDRLYSLSITNTNETEK